MRLLAACLAGLFAANANGAESRLETIFSETSSLIMEINAFDGQLNLHLRSFGRQGSSAAASQTQAAALSARAKALLKRWDAPTKEWKALPKERTEEFKSMRGWLANLEASVLRRGLAARIAFENAAAACDIPKISMGIDSLCREGCSSEDLLRGYQVPCHLQERKTVLLLPINREKLLGGKHHLGVEGGALTLQPHGLDALRPLLARYWDAVYGLPLSSVPPEEVELLRRYGAHIEADAPELATGVAAIERLRSIWKLHAHDDPAALEREAEAAATGTYAGFKRQEQTERAASSSEGIHSTASARDAISKVLRAAGSSRGVSNADAEKLLAANRSGKSTKDWPMHSLREAVLSFLGAPDEAVISDTGMVVLSGRGGSLRVIADPANGSFGICRDACGENDFLTIDGETPTPPKAKKEPKKKGWFGGSKDEGEAVVLPPTRFLIKELR